MWTYENEYERGTQEERKGEGPAKPVESWNVHVGRATVWGRKEPEVIEEDEGNERYP